MSVETVSALERGARRAPHRETVALLARALQLTPAQEAELRACSRTVGRSTAARQAVKHNLPSSLSSLIGRDLVVAEIADLVVTNRLFTLVGCGGIGKTRVAIEVAENLLGTWPDGVFLADLGALDDPTCVARTVAAAIGVGDSDERGALEALTETLRHGRTLLVLDSCEHLMHEVVELAQTVLRVSTDLHILATSRERLNIPGERVYRIPSLGLPPDTRLLSGEEALSFGAISLFVERAQASNRDFSLSAGNVPIVADICRRLDGIPLAIELAAAHIRALSPLELASQLDERLRLLTGGSPTAPCRHRTMRQTLDWSYDLLTHRERTLLRRAAAFGGGWNLRAAQCVCSGPELLEADVFETLSSLVEKSLVATELTDDETWYRLLETTRAYAFEKLKASGEEAAILERHANWAREVHRWEI